MGRGGAATTVRSWQSRESQLSLSDSKARLLSTSCLVIHSAVGLILYPVPRPVPSAGDTAVIDSCSHGIYSLDVKQIRMQMRLPVIKWLMQGTRVQSLGPGRAHRPQGHLSPSPQLLSLRSQAWEPQQDKILRSCKETRE